MRVAGSPPWCVAVFTRTVARNSSRRAAPAAMRIAIPPRARGVLLALLAAVSIGVDPLGTKFQTEAGSEVG